MHRVRCCGFEARSRYECVASCAAIWWVWVDRDGRAVSVAQLRLSDRQRCAEGRLERNWIANRVGCALRKRARRLTRAIQRNVRLIVSRKDRHVRRADQVGRAGPKVNDVDHLCHATAVTVAGVGVRRRQDVNPVEHRGHQPIDCAQRVVKVVHYFPAGGPWIARGGRPVARHLPGESRLAADLAVRAIDPGRLVAVVQQVVGGVVLRCREQRGM